MDGKRTRYDEQSFRRLVEFQAPTLLHRQAAPDLFERAVRYFAAIGRLHPADLGDCEELVRHWADYRHELQQAPHGHQPSAPRRAPPSPETQVTSAQLAFRLAPCVEAVRQDVFGQTHAPFASVREAGTWLNHEVHRHFGQHRAASNGGSFVGLWVDLGRVDNLGSLLDAARQGLDWALDAMLTDDGAEAPTGLDGPLRPLEANVRAMAEATGFDEADVLAYILCGLPPRFHGIAPVVTTSWKALPAGGGTIGRTQATITIPVGDLSWAEWKRCYAQIRSELPRGRGHALTELDAEFWALINRLGGVPTHEPVKFWKRVHQELLTPAYQQLGFPAYKDWRCARTRYVRLRRRLAGVRRRPPRRASGAPGVKP
jgi:hypothetical protein